MSDESKIARPGQQDEAPDEVEGHAKVARPGAMDEGRVARPGEIDEGDDVEAHGKFDSPKSDGKMV
jgi:hypothetical protein